MEHITKHKTLIIAAVLAGAAYWYFKKRKGSATPQAVVPTP